MPMYRVTYEILTEARTDTHLGSSRSDLQNLSTTVEAFGPGQARQMVEAQNGGYSRCRTYGATPL